MSTHFEQPEIEALKYYIYCLVDPRDKCIFYVGKGIGNRVFDHAKDALSYNDKTLKLDKIREILSLGLNVEYYIIRHGIESEHEAYNLESTIIDLFTYSRFNTSTLLTNIVAGHHQWDEGIKTPNEIIQLYRCEKLVLKPGHTLLIVSLNKTYNQNKANGVYIRPDLYESTRKYWRVDKKIADKVDYVLGVYKGVVRLVIKPTSKWELVTHDEHGMQFKTSRYQIEGITNDICGNDLYLHKCVIDYPFPPRGAIRYIK